MTESTTAPAIARHGAKRLPSVDVESYNVELRDHEGFVGDSYIGEWANLGAGTTTSNLKNTYGQVSLRLGKKTLPTGKQFLGSLIGSILVGFVQVLGAYYFQDLALAFMYFLMLIVLVIRPGGLLGKED